MTKDLEELAARAFDALSEAGPGGREPESRTPWRIQLRKGCAFLHSARQLQDGDQEGEETNTALVELGFSAIERTLQAVLMRQNELKPEEFQKHGFAIEQAGQRGIITDTLAHQLEQMWFEFRNLNYYRDGIPNEGAADQVIALAGAVHGARVRRRAEYRGTCFCPRN